MSQKKVLAALAVSWLVLAATPLRAQEATVISGTVTTAADGLPVPGATVAIESLGLSAVTDQEGRYTLTVPADVAKGQKVEIKVSSAALRPRVERNAAHARVAPLLFSPHRLTLVSVAGRDVVAWSPAGNPSNFSMSCSTMPG